MSILTENLPEHLVISGQECPIHTDFKTWLRFSEVISGGAFNVRKIVDIFRLIFPQVPPNMAEALDAAMWFYARNTDEATRRKSGKAEKKNFDFEYDADLIYSSFFQQYHIDLVDSSMHWWKFKALLNGLSEDTHFVKVVRFRTVDTSKIKDKEEKRYYLNMKAVYRLPDGRSEEQKERQLMDAMAGLF